jgi:hypothetical protein
MANYCCGSCKRELQQIVFQHGPSHSRSVRQIPVFTPGSCQHRWQRDIQAGMNTDA